MKTTGHIIRVKNQNPFASAASVYWLRINRSIRPLGSNSSSFLQKLVVSNLHKKWWPIFDVLTY